jgi:hypothetical protein
MLPPLFCIGESRNGASSVKRAPRSPLHTNNPLRSIQPCWLANGERPSKKGATIKSEVKVTVEQEDDEEKEEEEETTHSALQSSRKMKI